MAPKPHPNPVPKQIVELLRTFPGKGICDGCVQKALGLRQYQQIQQVGSILALTSEFNREPGNCARCNQGRVVTYATDN